MGVGIPRTSTFEVTKLDPTLLAAQAASLALKVATEHWGTACGLTFSPFGSSTCTRLAWFSPETPPTEKSVMP